MEAGVLAVGTCIGAGSAVAGTNYYRTGRVLPGNDASAGRGGILRDGARGDLRRALGGAFCRRRATRSAMSYKQEAA